MFNYTNNPTSKAKLLYTGCLIKTAFNHFFNHNINTAGFSRTQKQVLILKTPHHTTLCHTLINCSVCPHRNIPFKETKTISDHQETRDCSWLCRTTNTIHASGPDMYTACHSMKFGMKKQWLKHVLQMHEITCTQNSYIWHKWNH